MTSDNGFPAGSSHQTTKDFALSAPAGRIKCRLALKRIKNTVERIDSVLGLHSQKKKVYNYPSNPTAGRSGQLAREFKEVDGFIRQGVAAREKHLSLIYQHQLYSYFTL